jgi:NADH dehydrogenase FAD-containing subunit
MIIGEVTGVDKNNVCVGQLHRQDRSADSYDFLVLATGVTHSYFGRNEFEKSAPGLKSLADAVVIRNLKSMSLRMMTETVAAQEVLQSR